MANFTNRDMTKRLRELEGELADRELDVINATELRDEVARQVASYRLVFADMTDREEGSNGQQLRSEDLRNVMVEILEEKGQPMHYKDIHAALTERGIKVPGEDPVRNTGAHLSGDSRFEKRGQGLWGLSVWTRSNRRGTDWVLDDEVDLDALPFPSNR